MASKSIDRLCRSVLPPGYEQIRRQVPKLQRFLDENLPDSVRGSATLLTLDREQIVIAASTPLVANYLRLHGREIEQQLRETFGLQQKIRFRTVPDSLLRVGIGARPHPPREVSPESIETIERSAEWIEDEKLRASLLALAHSLKQK